MTLCNYGPIQSWPYTVVALYSCGPMQLWPYTVVAQYSYGSVQSWPYMTVALYNYGPILVSIWVHLPSKRHTVDLYSDGPI